MRITIEEVCRDNYVAAPGNEYELGGGVVGTMRAPVRALVKRFDSMSAEAAKLQGADRSAKSIDILLAVLDGIDADALRQADASDELIDGVVDRVIEDFFCVSRPTPSLRMRSLMASLTASSSNGVPESEGA